MWSRGTRTAAHCTLVRMLSLDATNAADYVRGRDLAWAGERIVVRELSGGVSNVVLLIERPDGQRLVLKQALPRLRVEQEWLCSIERIWREVAVLRLCGELLRGETRGGIEVRVPAVLMEDRENYCFAMTAAPAEHKTWKDLLLAGRADPAIAESCGRLLGRLHGRSWNDQRIATQLDDRTFFRDLRISPYYDQISAVHPDLAPAVTAVSESIWRHRQCLVHGDFSPKNLLVAEKELWLIDCEVGHYGDGAFDLGFFLTHLVLKGFFHAAAAGASEYLRLIDAFRAAYDAEVERLVGGIELTALWQRTIGALSGCLLARVDGKSPVDYLSPALQALVRDTARGLLQEPPAAMDELLLRVRAACDQAAGR